MKSKTATEHKRATALHLAKQIAYGEFDEAPLYFREGLIPDIEPHLPVELFRTLLVRIYHDVL